MFYCDSGSYCTVWDKDVKEKYVDIKISTSEKNENGDYKNSSWIARCVGKAFDTAKDFDVGKNCRKKIGKCKITNEVYKDSDGKSRTFLRVVIFNFEDIQNTSEPEDFVKNTKTTNSAKNTKQKPKTAPKQDPENDDDLPF